MLNQLVTGWHGSGYHVTNGKTMETLKHKIEELEKEEIVNALRKSGWVMSKAARMLGITERVIGYKINKYGIRTKEVRWIGQDDDVRETGKQ